MPKLDEVLKSREKKKFVKKTYRPWDLSGDGSEQTDQKPTTESPSLEQTTARATSKNKPAPEQQADTQKSEPKQEAPKPEVAAQPAIKEQDLTKPEPLESTDTPAIRTQLDDNLDNNKNTIREPLDNTKNTIRAQLDDSLVSTKETLRGQLDNVLNPETLENRIAKLSGVQESILHFVVDLCDIRGTNETGPIETSLVCRCIKTTYASTKTSISRLVSKGFLGRSKGKRAKGGYINLTLSNEVRDCMLKLKKHSHAKISPEEFVKSLEGKLENNLEDNFDIYSSSNINKKTNTRSTRQLSDNWQHVNIEPLVHIGFSKTQLKQLTDKNEPEAVQESINHFAFGLDNNPKVREYQNPLNVLMGVLRKGQSWIEPNYKSAKEIAQEALLEQKRAERERLEKLKEEAYKLALEEWRAGLNEDEIEKIAPEKKKSAPDYSPQVVRLSAHFREHVWPDVKGEYLC